MPFGRPVDFAIGAPPAGTPTWPPAWEPRPHEGPVLGISWPPTADQLDYWQKAITVSLLVLALPALLAALIHRPARLTTGLARKHVG
jgi:hypothetical protein